LSCLAPTCFCADNNCGLSAQRELGLSTAIVLCRAGGVADELPVAMNELSDLDDTTKVQVLTREGYLQLFMAKPATAVAAPAPAPAPAALPAQPAKNEDVLLVIESELVQTKAKLSLAVESFASLLASAQKELEITEPIVLCKATEAGEPIVVLTELGELENKMKVQLLRADGAGKAIPPSAPTSTAAQ